MLVEFVRDVFIVVAVLMALIAVAMRPAQDAEPARARPALDTRAVIPPPVTSAEGRTMQPSASTAAPGQ